MQTATKESRKSLAARNNNNPYINSAGYNPVVCGME
jgi:hypothetical protein